MVRACHSAFIWYLYGCTQTRVCWTAQLDFLYILLGAITAKSTGSDITCMVVLTTTVAVDCGHGVAVFAYITWFSSPAYM